MNNYFRNCYFCDNTMISTHICKQHVNGNVWVVHFYDKITLNLHKVYFYIYRGDSGYGFSLQLLSNTMAITHFPNNHSSNSQDILRLNSIPDNLTPETAQERLSFYLTFM